MRTLGIWMVGVLILTFIGLSIKQRVKLKKHERVLEKIVEVVDRNDIIQSQTDSLIIASINAIYKHLGVKWEIKPMEQDTTKEKKETER